MKGAPLRQTAQLSGFDLLYDPTHPSQFGLPQHQLVLRLHEEKAGQVPLLHGGVKTGSHLLILSFQSPHPLVQKRDSLLGRKRGQKRKPGRKLRVLLDRLPQKLAQPGEELLASRAGYLVDRPLGTPPLAYRLPLRDEPLPLQRSNHRVKRAVPKPHRLVLAPLTHQRDHLISVHRPLVEERHHRQSQRVGYLPLRRHRSSFSRYELIEIDYILGSVWCQGVDRRFRACQLVSPLRLTPPLVSKSALQLVIGNPHEDYCSVQPGRAQLPPSLPRKRESTAPGSLLLRSEAIYPITYEAYFLASTIR